ncbi:MAG: AAA family ATPase [Bacteroidia bacterium]|nr:AAA family ATPase [Bacteroidia bacterium]
MQKTNPSQFVNAVIASLPFDPNQQQRELIQKISNFLFSTSDDEIFILKGYAGTGKTNLIAAVTKSLPSIKLKSVLMAPTGRAAKVLSNSAGKTASTIHKKIFKKDMDEGQMMFSLSENNHTDTLFIVDEASMINVESENSMYQNNLLESLFEYVFSGTNCKLIFVGDTAQLPPVGTDKSAALDPTYLKQNFHLTVHSYELTDVARQRAQSGILHNATKLRESLLGAKFILPKLEITKDVVNLTGDELEDALNNAYSKYGEDDVIIVTRSNKRANLFNQNVRNRIRLFEEDLCTGDKLMVVKNNYFWLGDSKDAGFIANGDMAEIKRIGKREKLYGFNFTDCSLKLVDHDSNELDVKIITDSLFSDAPSLTPEQQQLFFSEVMLDCEDVTEKWKKMLYLKKSPFFNALQVKFSYAVTCHKAQGGQWPCVFIDHGFLSDEMLDLNLIRWLYTALTRASEKVYLINFNPQLLV